MKGNHTHTLKITIGGSVPMRGGKGKVAMAKRGKKRRGGRY